MAEWQYGRLIVLYHGERIEVRESWLGFRKTEVLGHDWTIEWYAGGQSSVEQVFGTDAMHVDVLNTLGQAGWEVATTSQSEGRFEYLLKRPEPGDDDDVG